MANTDDVPKGRYRIMVGPDIYYASDDLAETRDQYDRLLSKGYDCQLVSDVRDVNADGLGDRRGLAVEEVAALKRYTPSKSPHTAESYTESFSAGEHGNRFAVYIDGRVVAIRETRETAIERGRELMFIEGVRS